MISSHSSLSPSSAPVTSTSSLTPDDLKALQELHADLFAIAERAEQRHVKLIMDAEYSWYQPAVDAYVLALMMRFNRLPGRTSSSSALTTSTSSQSQSTAQPLIYQTYQAYLRRTPAYLAQSLDYAKEHGFALGAKLVRGAYHPHEMAAHASRIGSPDTNADKDNGEQGVVAQSKSRSRSQSISPDELPPVWATKAETDASYDHCVKMLLDAVAVDVNGSNSHSKASSGSSSWWSRLFGSDSGSSSSSRTLTGTSTVPSVAVLFGTHNYASCGLVLSALAERGLAHAEHATASGVPEPDSSASGSLDSTALPSLNLPSSTSSSTSDAEGSKHTSDLQPKVLTIPPAVSARVAFGQLYGMHDALTNALVDGTRASSPVVLKYVPYGGLREVMPYLSRRAIENRSVLFDGAAAAERRAAGREIWRRIVG
jgi:proline dehydrogenase